MRTEISSARRQHLTPRLTLDLLSLLVANMPRDLHRIADKGISTGVLHGALDRVIERDDIDGESSSASKVAELVVGRFGLDRLEGDEGRLASSLNTHVLWRREECMSRDEAR
jgi:hypothetical protein